MSDDHETIWLDCPHNDQGDQGRMWAEDNPFDPCEIPGCHGPVEFIRMDLHASAIAAAFERGKLAGLREAMDIGNENAWTHYGDDAYSRGLDKGAVNQSLAINSAIAARIAEIEGASNGR